jgi:hypothetical protein
MAAFCPKGGRRNQSNLPGKKAHGDDVKFTLLLLCCIASSFTTVLGPAFLLNLHADQGNRIKRTLSCLMQGGVWQTSSTALRGVSAGALFVRECTGLQCGFNVVSLI